MAYSKGLNVHRLMEDFSKRVKAAERELTNVEKSTKTLAEKDAAIRSEREALTEQITEHERTLAGLQGERNDLLGAWATATFEDDQDAMSAVQAKRAELDDSIEKAEQDIRKLRTSLESLEDTSEAAARLKFRLEQINVGGTVANHFAWELKNALVGHFTGLGTRKQQAELSLPRVDAATLEAVREEELDGYLEEKQAKQDSALKEKQAKQEREQKDEQRRALVRRINDVSGRVDDKGERLPRFGSKDYETYARTGVNPLPALKREYAKLKN